MARRALTLATFLLLTTSTVAQEAQQQAPAAADPSLPEVEVIQGQQPAPTAAPAAPKPKAAKPVAQKAKPPKPQQQQQPAAQQEFPEPLPAEEAAPELANSPYGSPASGGAQARATQSAQTPVNPTQLLPSTLDGFSAAATHVSAQTLDENRPSNINEALTRVPGVIVINDDAGAHHGGITVRGSPGRRSRKMLVMEDGHAVNLALWLDPSVHMWGPLERFESVEVLRGTVINHGPNNNFGVINGRNLSPFGPAESVISSAIGFTKTSRGSFTEIEEVEDDGEIILGDETVSKKDRTDLSYKWHAHTRQHAENVGIVASYTGANLQGAWDTETLRFNDFYGALGFKGSSSDVVVSLTYTRQRDNYDEQNFLGEAEIDASSQEQAEEIAETFLGGFAESQFNQLKHCKSCFAPAAGLNNYNGEVWRGQVVHNAYVDDDTTITSRVYAGYHRRDRYQLNSYGSDPDGTGAIGSGDVVFEPDLDTPDPDDEIAFFGDNTMFGRLRTFRHIGAEVRGEWANKNLLGFNNTIQAGVRYEYQDMTNRNFIGAENQILKNGDKGTYDSKIFDRELDANTVSAFLQTNVSVAEDFNIVPGIRFEWFRVGRQNRVVAREESEASGFEGDVCEDNFDSDECLSVDGLLRNPNPATESFSSFNALPGVAFAYTGFHKTTLFGGYHRGLTTGVLRNEDFPAKDEIGDNFNLGIRSSAMKGFDFEVVGFYQMIENYQYGASFSNVAGDRSFGSADEVEIGGVELYGRLNSQPFTGGPFNLYAEGNYTYARSTFEKLVLNDEDDNPVNFAGNHLPEVPFHVAALTLGIQQTTGWRWDASVTYQYRGSFFTDESNTAFGAGGEVEPDDGAFELEEAGEDGGVPSVWLLSARVNLHLGETGASVFVSGENLTDEFYISDREDGMKPGLGRTIWAGFKYKF